MTGNGLTIRQLLPACTPVTSIEVLDNHVDAVRQIETVQVDTVTVRVRTGYVERLDAAGATEQVPGNTGMKAIFDEPFPALQQPEPVGRDDQVQVTGFFAN